MCDGTTIVLVRGLGSVAHTSSSSLDHHGCATLRSLHFGRKAKFHTRLWAGDTYPQATVHESQS